MNGNGITYEDIITNDKIEELEQQLSQLQQLCDKYEKEQSTTFKVWLSVIDEHRKLQQEKEELIKDLKQFLNEWDEDDYVSKSIKLILSKLKESDKYKNKEDKYKNAWEELFNKFSLQSDDELYLTVKKEMQELEQKHGIEVE